MIKKIVTSTNKSTIYLSDVKPDAKGFIRVYSCDKLIGIILYSSFDYVWAFINNINYADEYSIEDEYLIDLDKKLKDRYNNIDYEFEEYDN